MDELAFLRALHRPGTIVDVGAHDGALTVPLAGLEGVRVVAFEPLPPAFVRLGAAVRAAHGGVVPGHVELRAQALGAGPGRLSLAVPVVGGVAQEQWASVAKDYDAIAAADPRVERVLRWEVEVVTLDSLGLADVTAMKVDAEGAEEEVLRGAEATLRRCMPVLTVEIEERHRMGSTRAVPAFLAGLGYRGFYALDGAWHPVAGFDAAVMQVASPSPASFAASDPYVFIFVFVPAEQEAEMRRKVFFF
ncbi:MAG: FkbM family methyltransferase [Acetobacteraceae bacterium]|nr:FkbM family methyltransferase [Acetobacteraceae bacterium]